MRILIADTNKEVRTALRLVIEQQETIQIIGEVKDVIGLLAQAAKGCPDFILLDADLPCLQERRRSTNAPMVELIETLHLLCPSARIIAFSSQPDAGKTCLEAKADAFICKSDPPDELLCLLEKIIT